MSAIMITKEELDYAVVIDGKKYFVYKKKKYKPVNRFFNSAKAMQYARDNRYSLIVSIVGEGQLRWLIMEEVVIKNEH